MRKENKKSVRVDGSSKTNEDLTMVAYNGIKRLLFRNEIVLGQQLNSRRLGKKLNMSSTPVIQALKLLHFQGLLAHIPQRGYFLERNSKEIVRDIFNLRVALESANLDTALKQIDEAGWQKLTSALAAHKEALEKRMPNKVLIADMTFHLALAEISTGVVGERLLRYLFEMLYLKSRPTVLYIAPEDKFCTHHQDILMSLRNNDLESARLTLTNHIQQVRDLVLQEMNRDEEDFSIDW